MKKLPRFNYIITIHNKEDLIENVLTSILDSCRSNSFIYPVLDGCTDKTEKIIDSIIKKNINIPIKKVYASDVHELLSINIGLKKTNQNGDGFNIILQDDVILDDLELENNIIKLYQWGGKKLGCISFRLGANFANNILKSDYLIPQTDHLESIYGHGLDYAETLVPNHFSYRDISIKSPVCFPFYVIKKIGLLEEKLAPYGHDDLEYAIRCRKAGFKNGVFALKFHSELKWGGTRTTHQPEMGKIIRRNINNIKKWNRKDLLKIINQEKNNTIYKIPGIPTAKLNNCPIDNTKKISLNNKNKSILIDKIKKKLNKNKFTNKILLKLKLYKNILNERQKLTPYKQFNKNFNLNLNFTNAIKNFKHPNKIYLFMHHYFYHLLPKKIRRHRSYFKKEKRGFGEDSFHSMWWLLLKEFKPKHCLEIGVYRGQVISLWTLIAKYLKFNCEVNGISPLKSTKDSVSSYIKNIDYEKDIKKSFKHFKLPEVNLVKALSTDKKAIEFIKSKKWDLIYIDGDHDYDTVLADYKLCKKSLSEKGLLIFDDSSLGTSFIPPFFSSAGHPGPSDVVKKYAMKELIHIGIVGHNNIFMNRI